MAKGDFEVIVVDELFHLRPGFRVPLGFNCVHIPPPRPKPYYDNSTGFNQALRLARGELVCFFVDYMWVEPDYLQKHWGFYKSQEGWTLSGYIDRYEFPKLHDDMIQSGLWSTFAQPFTPTHFTTHRPVYKERKGGVGIMHTDGRVEIPGDKIYLIPDSIPLAVLKQLNGLDEAYDGGYGVNDIDVGVRANMLGHRFALDPALVARKLGTPQMSARIPGVKKPYRRDLEWEESWRENFAMFQNRMQAIREGRESIAVPEGRGAWQ